MCVCVAEVRADIPFPSVGDARRSIGREFTTNKDWGVKICAVRICGAKCARSPNFMVVR